MNVLIVPSFYPSPDHWLRGIFFHEQAKALAAISGVRVRVATLQTRSLRAISPRSLAATRFQRETRIVDQVCIESRKGWNPMLSTITGGRVWGALMRRHVARCIQEEKPDIIHAHNALWAGHAVRRARSDYGVPVVLTEHDSQFLEGNDGRRWRFAEQAWHAADAVVAVSGALSKRLSARSSRHVPVIPNVVDVDFFSPAEVAREGFRFLAVANLVPVKGLDLLIKAFADAFPADSATRLRIVGDGPELSALRALAAARNVADRVTFLGSLPRERVRQEMRAARAFVLASRVETFGIALVEAMACGLPSIATRSGGPEDLVTKATGVLVPPENAPALSDALRQMRREFSRYDPAAIRESAQRFSPARIGGQILDLYRQVTSR